MYGTHTHTYMYIYTCVCMCVYNVSYIHRCISLVGTCLVCLVLLNYKLFILYLCRPVPMPCFISSTWIRILYLSLTYGDRIITIQKSNTCIQRINLKYIFQLNFQTNLLKNDIVGKNYRNDRRNIFSRCSSNYEENDSEF